MDFSHLAFDFQWEQCFSLIDKWKTTMIDHISHIHQEKISQIQMYKDQAEKISFGEKKNFILNMNEYFQHPCILSYEIDTFKNKLNQLKQNIIHRPLPLNIQIESYSLENSILISPLFTSDFFKQKQKLLAEYQIQTESIRFIATSTNEIILVNNQSKIFLYDKLIGFIDQINLEDYTNEYLNDICWSKIYKNFLFLCEHSLWSLENLFLKKLAQMTKKKNILNYLTSFHNSIFLIYNQGEFIDRWRIRPEWKLDKRWMKYQTNQTLRGVYSNNDYLLFYTKKSIQLCTEDLIIHYEIDLTHQEHLYSHFIYLSSYKIWLIIDQQTNLLNYFDLNHRIIQPIDQIFVQAISLMGENLAFITKDDYHLQIISI
jgi:hypothetical protein